MRAEQAARVILLRPANRPKHGFGAWLTRAPQRLHPNVLAAALATKLARIAWTVLAQERAYESRITKQPEKKTLRFTKGMAAAPRCPHRSPDWAIERRWLRGAG